MLRGLLVYEGNQSMIATVITLEYQAKCVIKTRI